MRPSTGQEIYDAMEPPTLEENEVCSRCEMNFVPCECVCEFLDFYGDDDE